MIVSSYFVIYTVIYTVIRLVSKRRHFHPCVSIHKYLTGEIDFNFNINRNNTIHSYKTRRMNDLHLPRVRTDCGKQTFIFQAANDWNNLDSEMKETSSLSRFLTKQGLLK